MEKGQKVKSTFGFFKNHTGVILEVGIGMRDDSVLIHWDNKALADQWIEVDDLEVIEESPVAAEPVQEVAAVEEPQVPALEGSEKQVKWANDIRSKAIVEGEAEVMKMVKVNPEMAKRVRVAFYEVLAQPELRKASWWIEGRSGSYATMIENRMASLLK